MAIIKAVNSKASIGKGINYIVKEEKTEEKLISGINCNPDTAIDEMKATKELYNKTDGRQYAHFIQSFNPKDNISPEKAHQIGLEWLKKNEKFDGFEIVMATHKDKEHIHNHFIINSVNFKDGHKLHTNKKEYQEMKNISNELSKEHDLTVPEKSQEKGKITSFNQGKYQAMKRHFEGEYKSYVIDTAIAVKDSKETAKSKDEFIKAMKDKGYSTNWKDTSKNVTFTDPEGKKVRLSNLEKTFNDHSFSKEELKNEFERNSKEKQRTIPGQQDRNISRIIDRQPIEDRRVNRNNEKLYSGTHGQGFNESNDSDKRDTSDRGYKQKITGRNDIDIEKARKQHERTNRDIAENIKRVLGPDASQREHEHRKIAEPEQSNNREHEGRIKSAKSRSFEHER